MKKNKLWNNKFHSKFMIELSQNQLILLITSLIFY